MVISKEMDSTDELSAYRIGEQVKVRVLTVDWGRDRLNLSMKRESGNVNSEYLEMFKEIPATRWLKGEIQEFAPFGAYFVRVTVPGSTVTVIGMLHISKIEEGFTRDTDAKLR